MSFQFSEKDEISTLHPNIIGFVPRYVSNRKEDYEKLKRSIEEEDYDAIRDYCHKVVGTARSYHFFQLEEITKELQQLGRERDMEGIMELLPAYDAYIRSVFSQYLAEVSGQKK